MIFLILGGTGYLGNRIVKKLSEKGNKVICIKHSDAKNSRRIRSENIIYLQAGSQQIGELIKREPVDWILNFSAKYEKSGVTRREIMEANYIYPTEILNLAIENRVPNFLTIDTSLPADFNLYALTKKQLADVGKLYARENKINFYNIILEMFYGSDEPSSRFLPYCIAIMKTGEELNLTDGLQRRDIIQIDDVVGGIIKIIESESRLKGYQDIPLGTGTAPTVREIVEFLHEQLGSTSKLNFGAVEKRRNEPDCCANTEVLEEMGYKLRYSWREGLIKMLEELQ